MVNQLAPGLLHVPLDRIAGINVYLVGDVLVDAGSRHSSGVIRRALQGRPVSLHALTHVHPDHQGSSKAVATGLGIPFAVPAGETEQAESGTFDGLSPGGPRSRLVARLLGGPGHRVDRGLHAGDEVGGFTAIALPGHTYGQLGYWRERDRVLVAGDAFRNLSLATGRSRPDLPPANFTMDRAMARATAESIAELRPAILAMGHGRPLIGESEVQRAMYGVLD